VFPQQAHKNQTVIPDNRLANLYWCDRSMNCEDSWDDGLMETGAKLKS
jgi:hypothetical protein